MIVVDSSSLVAIAEREPDWRIHLLAIQAADRCVMAGVNFVEAGMVLTSRDRFVDQDAFADWLGALGVEVDDSTALSAAALETFLVYGRGRHRARLNLGDCFAYALAGVLGAPLLYKGEDFALTDVRPVLQPT